MAGRRFSATAKAIHRSGAETIGRVKNTRGIPFALLFIEVLLCPSRLALVDRFSAMVGRTSNRGAVFFAVENASLGAPAIKV